MKGLRREQAGFTLVELLVATALSAMILPALTAGLVAYFRSATVAAVRGDRAHAASSLATALQPDLASASTASVSGSCSNRLTLSWSEPDPLPGGGFSAARQYTAVYSVTGASPPHTLTRALHAPGSSTTSRVARGLPSACAATFAVAGTLVSASVAMSTSGDDTETTVLRVGGRIKSRQP